MSSSLYACVFAVEFPAQALLRLRTDWQTEAVAVLDGRAPQEWVCSMNRLAARKGAAMGMTRLEAESIVGLRRLKRSIESEAAAKTVFRECAAKFSPRIEEASEDGAIGGAGKREMSAETTYALVLDITGTERLFGPPQRLAERLRDELTDAGFRASIAVSANYNAARIKAAEIRGIAMIPEGAEAEALARLPMAALNLDEERAATFALWGINTLGELAALPEAELVARTGPEARRWRALARGAAEHAFVPVEPEFSLEEFCEFETPVEQIDSLLFVGARMIDCLVTRAAGRALALTSLKAEMRLEGGATHSGAIRPAAPSADRKFLLKLLQLEIGAHPPQAAVVALTLRAEAGQTSKVQLGLFTPQTPEPSRLDVTLARLRALVGEDRVGSPVLEDTHRTDGFRMEGFAVQDANGSHPTQAELGWSTHKGQRMALRRVRPARAVRVLVTPIIAASYPRKAGRMGQPAASPSQRAARMGQTGLRPVSFRDEAQSYQVVTAYGPWRTSGCWWALDAWDTEEWDVLAVRVEELPTGANQVSRIKFAEEKQPQILRLRHAARGFAQDDRQAIVAACSEGATIACLLVHDRTRNTWRLEAFYD